MYRSVSANSYRFEISVHTSNKCSRRSLQWVSFAEKIVKIYSLVSVVAGFLSLVLLVISVKLSAVGVSDTAEHFRLIFWLTLK